MPSLTEEKHQQRHSGTQSCRLTLSAVEIYIGINLRVVIIGLVRVHLARRMILMSTSRPLQCGQGVLGRNDSQGELEGATEDLLVDVDRTNLEGNEDIRRREHEGFTRI
jgi:hypothetical protein